MTGTVCSYPAFNPTPTREHRLWEGYPEASNGPYGIAKLMALEQLQSYNREYGLKFVYPVLSNLYGPGQAIDEQKSHVIPALIQRFIANPEKITIWGDGTPTRDFLYVEDAARALIACMQIDHKDFIYPFNVASGFEISIRVLVEMLIEILDYRGLVEYDASRPNGQARRGYDARRAMELLGWKAQTKFKDGLAKTVEWFKQS
jgi:GDP-L-fucose synthase